MGHIQTSKLDNGMVGLEITYGGKDSPFGGVDASAPPMYIAPNCFTDVSSFLIIDGVLRAAGWFPCNITLGGWTSGMTYLDSGHFYQNGNYWNWALAYTTATNPPSGGNPQSIDVTYSIWTWQTLNPGIVPITSTLVARQTAIPIGATNATASVELIGPPATGTGSDIAAFYISFNNNTMTQSAGQWINAGDSPSTIIAAAVAFFNTDPPVNAVASFQVDPGNPAQMIITAKTAGTAGNSPTLTLQAWIQPGTATSTPSPVITQHFAGGANAYTIPYGIPPNPVTWVNVGETLYIGGYGTMILQYSQSTGTPVFAICTSYLGAICLGKFNSQLIAAGIVPGPGSASQGTISQPEMILAWSAPNELSVWNPEHGDGTVTGAGFNQLSDISDYLTGIIITPGTAVILRTQGIDYITPLAGGITPFDFAHISNSLAGEGCQHLKLVTEYDQIGAFIGNTDVYQFSGSLVPIGDKIRNAIYSRPPSTVYRNRDSASGPVTDVKTAQVLNMFVIDSIIYIYNLNNKTWMLYYLNPSGANVFDVEWLARDVIPAGRPQDYVNYSPVLITEDTPGVAPAFWSYQLYVQDGAFPHAMGCYCNFVQEEISFGRDITIESAYVSIAGTPGLVIYFWISGKLEAQLTLPSTSSPTAFANYQIFFTFDPTKDDKTTVKNPQLTISMPYATLGSNSTLSIAKVAVFGSFDPAQRPV